MKSFDISNLIPTSLHDVRRVCHCPSGEIEATASHSAIIIKKSGNTHYRFKDHLLVSDENTVIFIAEGTKYGMTVVTPGDAIVIEFGLLPAMVEKEFKNGFVCEYSIPGDKTIIKLAKNLLQYYNLRGPAYLSKCFSELYSLITQISNLHSYNRSLAGKYGLIHESVKFIEKNYARQDLYTSMLAELSDMGETYYRSIFQAVFNMPPAKYIQFYRVLKAKELLLGTDSGVEEIAIAVGFANASYFCKVFKTITGVTPSEFALKCKALG